MSPNAVKVLLIDDADVKGELSIIAGEGFMPVTPHLGCYNFLIFDTYALTLISY